MNELLLKVLRWVSILAVLAQVSRLEVEAGLAAGWPLGWALLIPFAVDAGVLLTLLTPRMRWYDRVGAIALLEGAVVLSVLHPNSKLLGVGIATALVLTLMRVESLFREAIGYRDVVAGETARWRARWRSLAAVMKEDRHELAYLGERVANAEAEVRRLLAESGELRRQLLAIENGETGDASPSSPSPRGLVQHPAIAGITDPGERAGHLAAKLEHGWRGTWRDVQGMWPDLGERGAQHLLTAARRLHKRHGLTAVQDAAGAS